MMMFRTVLVSFCVFAGVVVVATAAHNKQDTWNDINNYNEQIILQEIVRKLLPKPPAQKIQPQEAPAKSRDPSHRRLSLGAFSWNDCGKPSDLAKVYNLTILPDPLQIPGNVTVSVTGSLSKDIQAPLALSVEIKKHALFWVPIPCLDNIGSCNYDDICSLLEMITCPPPFQKYGMPCHCPFKAGHYNLPKSSIEVNAFNIPSWLDEGKYQVTGTLSTPTEQVICLHAEFELN